MCIGILEHILREDKEIKYLPGILIYDEKTGGERREKSRNL